MTDIIMPRRSFITGLVGLVAAPAVVKASSLMRVKAIDLDLSHVSKIYDYNEIGYGFKITKKVSASGIFNSHWIPQEPPPYVIELYEKIGKQYD